MKENKVTIHETSDVLSSDIGKGTTIWQFCVILDGARIGIDCNICSSCFIENGASIGDRVTIKNGVYIWTGVTIEDDVFVGPNVSFTNDRYPKSQRVLADRKVEYSKTLIKKGSSIGAGAVILPGVIIGEGATVGAGSVVTKNVESETIVFGNPALPKKIRK